jgi:hypothetical protein
VLAVFPEVVMRAWLVACIAVGVGCSFDANPRFRHAGPASTSDRNVVGLIYDGAIAADAGGSPDASSPSDAGAATVSGDAAALQSDASIQAMRDSAVTSQDPSRTPVVPSEPMSSDAAPARDGESAETPDASQPAVDAATPATDAGSTSALRTQMLQLLKVAQFSRDDRALPALLSALVADAKSGAELAQVLAVFDTDGQCALLNAVTCVTACGIVATRCSLCVADPGCATELQHVCGVDGPNCR